MLKPLSLAMAVVMLGAAAPAFASDDAASCGNAPRDKWMSEDAIKAKATEMGYKVRSVKVEDGCYEVYGHDKNDVRVEIYLNPVTGAVVRTKGDD